MKGWLKWRKAYLSTLSKIPNQDSLLPQLSLLDIKPRRREHRRTHECTCTHACTYTEKLVIPKWHVLEASLLMLRILSSPLMKISNNIQSFLLMLPSHFLHTLRSFEAQFICFKPFRSHLLGLFDYFCSEMAIWCQSPLSLQRAVMLVSSQTKSNQIVFVTCAVKCLQALKQQCSFSVK